jgi:hypothetical protein
LFPEETKNNQSPVVRLVIPILSDFPTAITVSRVGINRLSNPYLFGETSFVVAGFIPAY